MEQCCVLHCVTMQCRSSVSIVVCWNSTDSADVAVGPCQEVSVVGSRLQK